MPEALRGHSVIFWDFDGTLAFRGRLFASSLRMAMDEWGVYPEISVDEMVPFMKNCLPWHFPDEPHTEIASSDEWWERLLYPALDAALIRCGVPQDEARTFTVLSRKHAVDHRLYDVYEDTLPAMELAASEGFRQFILSNHVPELPNICKALGLMQYAERCITSALEGYEKPHPMLYQRALAIAGRPIEAWMIGDNLEGDVRGSAACGMTGILVRKPPQAGYLCSSDLPGAVGIIQRMEENKNGQGIGH